MRTEQRIRNLLKGELFQEVYSDVNLEYGGLFVRENEPRESYSVIEITDLDGGCGAEGQILVSAYEVSFSCYSNKDKQSALESMGWDDMPKALGKLAREGKRELARCILAGEMSSYGLHDPAGYGVSWFVAVLDRVADKESRERWLDNRVKGWGWAAIYRAVENAIAMCDHSHFLPNELEKN